MGEVNLSHRRPVKVETQCSVSEDQLRENITENLRLINTWVGGPMYLPHDGVAICVSAGHSFQEDPSYVDALKEQYGPGKSKVFAVKHCLPKLREENIIPDYLVALDPRPVDDVSTLGEYRKDLYGQTPSPGTTYLIASMTSHTVTQHLLDIGAKVVGWHSLCEVFGDFADQAPWWVGGGSCSAMRSIALAYTFGFRRVVLLGYDSHVRDTPPETEKEKSTLKNVIIGDKKFWLTGELMAQVQDLEILLKQNRSVHNMELINESGGVCRALFEGYGKEQINNPKFLERGF